MYHVSFVCCCANFWSDCNPLQCEIQCMALYTVNTVHIASKVESGKVIHLQRLPEPGN